MSRQVARGSRGTEALRLGHALTHRVRRGATSNGWRVTDRVAPPGGLLALTLPAPHGIITEQNSRHPVTPHLATEGRSARASVALPLFPFSFYEHLAGI